MPAHLSPPALLTLLGNKIRWQLLQSLALSDMSVQELTQAVTQPQNLVSYHLHKLLEHGIVREHRSIADGRVNYYNLDLNRLAAIYAQIGYALHPALSNADPFTSEELNKKINVLFICTHNSARSQIAEAVLRAESSGAVEAHSAGTEPVQIHPLAIKVLEAHNFDPTGLHSKDLARFTDRRFQYIITVCDRVKESCPVFPGNPIRAHWSIPDPAEVQGDEHTRYAAFKDSTGEIQSRTRFLLKQIQNDYSTIQ